MSTYLYIIWGLHSRHGRCVFQIWLSRLPERTTEKEHAQFYATIALGPDFPNFVPRELFRGFGGGAGKGPGIGWSIRHFDWSKAREKRPGNEVGIFLVILGIPRWRWATATKTGVTNSTIEEHIWFNYLYLKLRFTFAFTNYNQSTAITSCCIHYTN